MIVLEERVSEVEKALVVFVRETATILAANREDVAEMRVSNARTDRLLLQMQQQAEKDREQAEKDRQQLRDASAETDRRFAEWREQAEKHWEQAEKDRQQIRDASAETDRRFAEMREQAERDREKADLDRQKAEKDRIDFNRRLAEATDAQGLLIENMVWPNLKRIATEVFRGSEVLFQGIRIKKRLPSDHSRMMELDLLAVGESELLVCEAKSKVTADKVREFTQSIEDFFDFFPEHAGKRLWPMVASVMIDPSVVAFMTSRQVLALGFGGETMDLLNPEALAG